MDARAGRSPNILEDSHMKRSRLINLGLVAAAGMFAACSESTTSPVTVESDSQLIADVAAQSGEAIASDVEELTNNESFAGLPAPPAFDVLSPPGVTVNRTRTCYGNGVAQAACNATTTDSVRLTVTMDGSFIRTNTRASHTDSMNVALHRARQLTISGLTGTETTRIHNGTGTDNDTTSFNATGDAGTRARNMTVAGNDSVQAVVFNVPRGTNPWPVSGKFIRNVSGSVTVTGGANPGTRTFTRRVEVDFPADAQGNVTLKVNDKTCTLNLTTHVVANCST
jgi:hypothetical protein